MSDAEQTQVHPQTPVFSMLRTLGGIAMLSGFLVVLVVQWTEPIIAENHRIAIETAVFKLVPNSTSRRDFFLGEQGLFAATEDKQEGEKIYAAYAEDGNLQGIVLETVATGYQDVIRILYAYNPDCECITGGIKVLKMTETPGLGDKIAFDPEFLKNFDALDAKLNDQGTGLAHEIVTVKHGTKSQPWQIDSISGATISSNAIGRMLNQSGQRMFPLIISHLQALKQPEAVSTN